jgi:membrane protein
VIGALFAGIVFQLWQWVYIHFQVQIWNYSTVYGTFAIIPLFLVWVQFSWLIALAGAEIASAIESKSFRQWGEGEKLDLISKNELALVIIYNCLEKWHAGKQPLQLIEISHIVQIPVKELGMIVEKLEKAGVLAMVRSGDADVGYYPGSDPSTISIRKLIEIMGSDIRYINVISSPAVVKAHEIINAINKSSEELSSRITLNQLIR